METQPPAKTEVELFVIAIFATRSTMIYVLTNQVSLNKKVTILNWKKFRLRDPASATGQFMFKKGNSFICETFGYR